MRFNLLRIFLIISIIFLCNCAEATIYHVATDGSGDFITIAQVNAYSFGSGDTIEFRGGDTWAEQLNCKSNLTYQSYGTGKGKIQNILIDTRSSQPKSNINIKNLIVNANSLVTYGIYCASDETALATNILIDGCDIYDCRYGIQFYLYPITVVATRFQNITITNNNIYSNSEYGIALTEVDNLYCANNNIYDNGDNTILSVNGIWVATNTNGIIEHNIVYSNDTGAYDGVGIFLDWTGAVGCSNMIVRNNKCCGHISKWDTQFFSEYSFIGAADSSGICVMGLSHDNYIYNNICYGNAIGIAMWTQAYDNYFYNNTVVGNAIGILSSTTDKTNYIKNNIVSDNTLAMTNNTLDGTEHTTNGNFESGDSNWSNYFVGTGTFSVVSFEGSNVGKITAITSGAISLWNSNISIESGKYYKLNFRAKTTVPFYMSYFHCHDNNSPYATYATCISYAPSYQITTNWKNFSVYFKGVYTGSTGRIQLRPDNLPSGAIMYVDDVSLKETNYDVNGGIVVASGTLSGDYNDNYNNENNTYGFTDGIHSISSDPLLTTSYHLTSTSPCKDTGITLTGVIDDYEGNPRPMGVSTDMGAYEYFKCKVRNATLRNCNL